MSGGRLGSFHQFSYETAGQNGIIARSKTIDDATRADIVTALSERFSPATLQRPFSPSSSVTAGGVGLCITDLMAFAKFHIGDGT